MSASFQALPPPGPPPPSGVVYPTTVTNTQPSSHSNGSFGAVFIVLAVIIVVSAIACCLGRLCTKRSQHSNQPKGKYSHSHNHNHKSNGHNGHHQNGRVKDRELEFGFRSKEGDIELGFDKRIPMGKPVMNGEARGYKPRENGEFRNDNRAMNGGDPRDFE
ncbi:hypothetical protein Ancab_020504 [Ancistrocladus abbreviatus]